MVYLVENVLKVLKCQFDLVHFKNNVWKYPIVNLVENVLKSPNCEVDMVHTKMLCSTDSLACALHVTMHALATAAVIYTRKMFIIIARGLVSLIESELSYLFVNQICQSCNK
jgi:hypothetical protein